MALFYRWLWWLLTPALLLLWWHRARLGKESRARRAERFGKASSPRPRGVLIWLHGASVGESLSLLALIDEMRAAHPAWRYLVTTGTVTSATLMAQRLPPEAMHQFIPFDHPYAVRRFLRHWQPNGVLWVESEIWPNLLAGIRQAGVPAALLNARISARSARRWGFFGAWARALLGVFQMVAAQTPADAARLQPFCRGPVLTLGNLKFVGKPLPVEAEKQQALAALLGEQPVWLLASSHASEEAMAARMHVRLRAIFPNLITVIALRHPARGAQVAKELASLAPVARRSLNETPSDIYLCDTLGEMGTLYSTIKTVVMGGSFTVGGHNPIEPAQLGCAIICGPLMYNFTAICAAFDSKQALLYAPDEATVAARVQHLLQNAPARAALGAAAAAVCAEEAKSLPHLWHSLADWREAVQNNYHTNQVSA